MAELVLRAPLRLPAMSASMGVSGDVETDTAPPIATGEWEQLSIANHTRVVPVQYQPALTEAATATTENEVPARNFCAPIMDDEGRLLIFGSLHSDYPGNEMDIVALDPGITGTVLTPIDPERPHVPDLANSTPSASIVYVIGGGSQTWQSYAFHTYGRVGWHPVHGYIGANLTGVASWSGDTPTYTDLNGAGGASAVIAWDEATNLWSVVDQDWIGPTGTACVGEYDTFNEVLPIFFPYGTHCYVAEVGHVGQYNLHDSSTRTRAVTYAGNTLTPVSTAIPMTTNNQNGNPSHYLDYGRHLVILLANGTDNATVRVFLWDHYAKTSSEVTLDSTLSACPSGQAFNELYCAIDRGRRHIYWGKRDDLTLTIYRSGFDTPGVIDATVGDTLTLPVEWNNRCVKPLWWWKDALFCVFPENVYPGGETYFWRMNIYPYSAPSLTVEKLTTAVVSGDAYSAPLWKGKHFNHAVDGDDVVWSMGGDLTDSSNQRMFKYESDAWTQTLDYACDGRLTGDIRPSQPDDGGWFWDATAGKFWWLPGGGQLAYGGEVAAHNICDDEALFEVGEAYTKAEINATRWKCYEMMTFDPSTEEWAVVTFTADSTYVPDGGRTYLDFDLFGKDNASRGNAYDPVTRTIYRFVTGGWMAAFKLATLKIEMYYIGALTDGTSWPSGGGTVRDGMAYAHQSICVDPDTGYVYFVLPATSEFYRMAGRGTPILHDGGSSYRLPVEALSNPIPAILAWNRVDDSTNSSGGDKFHMRVWKGGLLFWWGLTYASSKVQGAFWRDLSGITSNDWQPVHLPVDFRAGCATTNAFSDGSILAAQDDYTGGTFYKLS